MNLQSLNDIVLPEPVSWMPQTVGWVVVAVGITLLSMRWAWARYQRWLRNRYRREGLELLDRIRRELPDPTRRPEALRSLPGLLKRIALSAAPRTDVAALSGSEWLEFLDTTYGAPAFSGGAGRLLPTLAYASDDRVAAVPAEEIDTLMELAGDWIRDHRVPTVQPTGPGA
jgi:hypothetical protein